MESMKRYGFTKDKAGYRRRDVKSSHSWHPTSFAVAGCLSLLWLLLRTGTRPTRIVYPCQRVALAQSHLFLSLTVLPAVAAAGREFIAYMNLKKTLALIFVVLLIGMGGWWIYASYRQLEETRFMRLTLQPKVSVDPEASSIFVVNGVQSRSGDEYLGLNQLIDLMGSNGLPFYKSNVSGRNRGLHGLIAYDDVVVVKVNCQWDQRGGTNTDLVKGLIRKILDHPDGFIGEIVVADNGQGRGSLNWRDNNAVNRSQSIQAVVNPYAVSHKVSTYLWDTISSVKVKEYVEADARDGYVLNPTADPATGITVSYPKFKTVYDTYISLKHGIWDPSSRTYDSGRLKLINVPVLKSHSSYGVTACIKNYMGVQSQSLSDGHRFLGRGAMGTVMAQTRYPVLNILDAIWVNANPKESGNPGPGTPYEHATNVNVILASTDPVALDYWASKHVLLQAAKTRGYTQTASLDPDNPNTVSGLSESFCNYLERSMRQLSTAGYRVTMDEAKINVYVEELA